MQFSESWLRNFCNPDISTDALAECLTMAGLEVEDLRSVAPAFTQVVVAKVIDVHRHPDADRLNICSVDIGRQQTLQIVCGAPNVRAGIVVPCALVGANLPSDQDGGFTIKASKIRGIQSDGMLCSARELGLSQDAGGLMLLDGDAPLGSDLREHLQLNDHIFVLKLTPNLAHCLSVRGIARELSAISASPLKPLAFKAPTTTIPDSLKVKVHATDLCGRFSGRVIKGVNIHAATPQWMLQLLERCGQRSVNALVDISNYVMFEMGQPTHIFDLDKIRGDLHVRWAKPGESLELLNGQTVVLDEHVGVISDDHCVESLAGIMGGNSTAVSDSTINIYVEAAFWWPRSVAGRSRRFNFSTDAGHRFERGVDPLHTVEAIERISQLVLEICGGQFTQCGPIDDQILSMPKREKVTVRVARVNRVLGMDLDQAQIVHAFDRLGLLPQSLGTGVIEVQPPSHRFDLNIEEDLIEEVARMIGFDHLPTSLPCAPISPRVQFESVRHQDSVRRQMAQLGYQETINFSFIDKEWELKLHGNLDPVVVLNPIASQMGVMRSSLLGSLLQVVKYNVDRKLDSVHAFEIGRAFRKDPNVTDSLSEVAGFSQHTLLAGIRYGSLYPTQWSVPSIAVDFFDVKADLEALFPQEKLTFRPETHPGLHPGRTACVYRDEQPIGFLGELHPKWMSEWNLARPPIFFELRLDAVMNRGVSHNQQISKFPSVSRDVSVVVNESVVHDQIIDLAWSIDHAGFLKDVILFDVYRPQVAGERGLDLNEKSMAIRLILNNINGTLSEDQIEDVRTKVIASLVDGAHARLRD